MNFPLLQLLALLAGAAIAIQAGLNTRLGVLLQNPFLAASVALTGGSTFTLLVFLFTSRDFPNMKILERVPVYLWFSGGLLGAFALSVFYWLIPKIGVGPLVSFSLAGQLILAMVASHFGWFQLPVIPLTTTRLSGIVAMMLGILLINRG